MKYKLKNGLVATDFDVDGINTKDYPDFCDAYICDASVMENGKWRDATDAEIDELNNDGDFVYECVENRLY